jgi:hypothetical protein
MTATKQQKLRQLDVDNVETFSVYTELLGPLPEINVKKLTSLNIELRAIKSYIKNSKCQF